jgi:hypothetical protein
MNNRHSFTFYVLMELDEGCNEHSSFAPAPVVLLTTRGPEKPVTTSIRLGGTANVNATTLSGSSPHLLDVPRRIKVVH